MSKVLICHPIIDEAYRRGIDMDFASEIFLAGVKTGRERYGQIRFGKVGEPGEPISRTCLICKKQFQDIIDQIEHDCKP